MHAFNLPSSWGGSQRWGCLPKPESPPVSGSPSRHSNMSINVVNSISSKAPTLGFGPGWFEKYWWRAALAASKECALLHWIVRGTPSIWSRDGHFHIATCIDKVCLSMGQITCMTQEVSSLRELSPQLLFWSVNLPILNTPELTSYYTTECSRIHGSQIHDNRCISGPTSVQRENWQTSHLSS